MQKVLVIVGPTASGKSALAVKLAKKFDGEVVSADSRQTYRGLDIGTGKITKREMKGVPHHLLNVASPRRTLTACDFVNAATKAIDEMSRRGKLPVVVGGTGFYIDALVGRIALPNVPPDPALRKRLRKKSAARLFALIQKKDAGRAKALSSASERNNKVRLIRALEIAYARKPMIESVPQSFDVLWIGLKPTEAELRRRIAVRLRARIRAGMLAEAKRLHRGGLSYKRMRELGLEYRSLARLLQKEISFAQFGKEMQSAIWRYARKQLGYWKRNEDIRWFEPGAKTQIESEVRRWLNR